MLNVAYDHRGAFDADGRLIAETLRLWGHGDGECPDDVPESIPVSEVVATDRDEVVWGGPLTGHYGHFLTESTARLWPLMEGGALEGRPVVFATHWRPSFADEWLEAFGVETIDLPHEGVVRFANAWIPEPAWRMGGWVAPEMRDVHLQARAGLDVPELTSREVLWMSRARLDRHRRVRDELLCQWLLRDYVRAIYPESMSLGEQVAEIEASSAIVGPIGSAFHTLLTARHAPPCVFLAPANVASSFTAQEILLGTPGTFVHALAEDGESLESQGRHPYRLLIPETLRALASSVLPEIRRDPLLDGLAHPERYTSKAVVGRTESADLEILVARVLLDPYRVDARMTLGARFEDVQQFDCALEQFEIVTDLVEGYAYAPLRGARLLSRLGKHEMAAELADRAIAIDPTLSEAQEYVDAVRGERGT